MPVCDRRDRLWQWKSANDTTKGREGQDLLTHNDTNDDDGQSEQVR